MKRRPSGSARNCCGYALRVGKSSLFHTNNYYCAVANLVQHFCVTLLSLYSLSIALDACQIPIAQLIFAALKISQTIELAIREYRLHVSKALISTIRMMRLYPFIHLRCSIHPATIFWLNDAFRRNSAFFPLHPL